MTNDLFAINRRRRISTDLQDLRIFTKFWNHYVSTQRETKSLRVLKNEALDQGFSYAQYFLRISKGEV